MSWREVTDYKVSKALVKIAVDLLKVRTASYDHTWNEEVIGVNRNSGVTTVDINLGTPVGYSGKRVVVKNLDAATDNITIKAPVVTKSDGTSYQSKIDGNNTVVISKARGYVEIYSDGDNFFITNADLS